MKLRTLAIAVAMASVATAAQADLKISGDVAVGYFAATDGTDRFGTRGNNITFAAEETVGSMTYYGNADVDFGNGTDFVGDDIRVGMKGAFGELVMGDTDNGCDATDIGGTNEVWETHSQGGCQGNDRHNITYKRAFGNFSGAISHNPDAESSALGFSGTMGPVGISLGYETDITNTTTAAVAGACANTAATYTVIGGTPMCVTPGATTVDAAGVVTTANSTAVALGAADTAAVTAVSQMDNNIVLGLTGKIGPVSVGFRANKLGDNDAVHGINALYTSGANSFYGGMGTSDGNDTKSIGFKHVRGNTDFILEASDSGVAGEDNAVSAGIRHRF